MRVRGGRVTNERTRWVTLLLLLLADRTFDGRDGAGKPTAVRFATDLTSASALTSVLFIGLDVSASTLPTLPDTLREL